MRRDDNPEFIEALARGLDVLRCFTASMTLSEVATATGLARPTARRILITLEQLGYVRSIERGFTPSLTVGPAILLRSQGHQGRAQHGQADAGPLVGRHLLTQRHRAYY